MNGALYRLKQFAKRPIYLAEYLRYRDGHESPVVFIAGLPKAVLPGWQRCLPAYLVIEWPSPGTSHKSTTT